MPYDFEIPCLKAQFQAADQRAERRARRAGFDPKAMRRAARRSPGSQPPSRRLRFTLQWRYGLGSEDRFYLRVDETAEANLLYLSYELENALGLSCEAEMKRRLFLIDTAQTVHRPYDHRTGEYSTPIWTPREWTLLVGDFDDLPPTFSTWVQFRAELEQRFPEAVVLPSPRGKAKILFLARDRSKRGPDHEEQGARWWALRRLVGRDLAKWLDPSPTASHRIFFTSTMLYRWREAKDRLRPAGSLLSLARQAGWRTTRGKPRKRTSQLPRYGKRLPDALASCGRGKAWRPFLRILLAAPVMEAGLRLLSHERIAATLRVAPTTVRGYADQLIKGGYLRRAQPGRIDQGQRQASLYAFTEKLFELLPALRDVPRTMASRAPLARPETVLIADGDWHTTLFDIAYAVSPQAATGALDVEGVTFLDYVARIPGASKKDRMKQARSIWRYRLKRSTRSAAAKAIQPGAATASAKTSLGPTLPRWPSSSPSKPRADTRTERPWPSYPIRSSEGARSGWRRARSTSSP